MINDVSVPSAENVPRRKALRDAWTSRAIDTNDFAAYKLGIIHDWLNTLTLLASILVPLFFVLDILLVPHALLPRFGVYRFISMVIALIQLLVVRRTQPSRWSYLHGYIMSIQVGGFIALMTVSLGGFDSSYYAASRTRRWRRFTGKTYAGSTGPDRPASREWRRARGGNQ